jgi:hypothetical protein
VVLGTGSRREAIVLHLPLNVLVNTFQLSQFQSSVCLPTCRPARWLLPHEGGLQSQELLSWADPVTGRSITRVNRIVIDNARDFLIILSLTCQCQTQYDSKDQESKVHTLRRVDDDAHPGAAEAPAWKWVQEDTTSDRS